MQYFLFYLKMTLPPIVFSFDNDRYYWGFEVGCFCFNCYFNLFITSSSVCKATKDKNLQKFCLLKKIYQSFKNRQSIWDQHECAFYVVKRNKLKKNAKSIEKNLRRSHYRVIYTLLGWFELKRKNRAPFYKFWHIFDFFLRF